MHAKTSQLQIRVSPAEKAALRRLADQAGVSVSAFVLQRALPRTHEGISARIRHLQGGKDLLNALSDFMLYLSTLSHDEFEDGVAAAELAELTTLQLNCAAAAVEHESWRRGLATPFWTGTIPPLERPYFAWGLRSLRPRLLRVTPAAFKRRNVYVPSPGDPRR
jgi:hypothetical protein